LKIIKMDQSQKRFFTILLLVVFASRVISCAAAKTPDRKAPNGIASLEKV
jgi:hypothetical protein